MIVENTDLDTIIGVADEWYKSGTTDTFYAWTKKRYKVGVDPVEPGTFTVRTKNYFDLLRFRFRCAEFNGVGVSNPEARKVINYAINDRTPSKELTPPARLEIGSKLFSRYR